jgi:hypothetical protein
MPCGNQMTFTKNKSTDAGREFWEHVEAVAERVRQSPQLRNHRAAGPLNKPSDTPEHDREQHEKDEELDKD